MPRRPLKARRLKKEPLDPEFIYYLETGHFAEDAPKEIRAMRFFEGHEFDKLWRENKHEILDKWIQNHPGTRPWAWWEYDAPRWKEKFDAFYDGKLPEPRLRIGGSGTAAYEVFHVIPCFTFGIPCTFVSEFDESYYNGRAKDIHGNPIGTNYKEGHFQGKAIDPEDPPIFESEAAYLLRHDLLTHDEQKWIDQYPATLKPETIAP